MVTHGTVVSADVLATRVGVRVLAQGGTAVDAAVATNAAMAVVGPHLCGVGGDLLALVHTPDGSMECLVAAGRAGSGADPDALRAEGCTTMPATGDIRTVTVPGCVDGWVALHERHGTLPLADLLAPAVALAADGFAAAPLLVRACAGLAGPSREQLGELVSQAVAPGATVCRVGLARTLAAVGAQGRDAFYLGEFGDGLLRLGRGWYAPADLATSAARWVEPLRAHAFGVDLWTAPPPSQGYLWLAAATLADRLGPPDPADPGWAHLLVECAVAAGHDRVDVLHDGADGAALLAAAAGRVAEVDVRRASGRTAPAAAGDTTYLAAVDDAGWGVSLIQSNASGFGSGLVEPATQVNLHNRGLGFSLVPGHPAELAGGRRPPHTLLPGAVTDAHGLRALLGTMGGDAQPQVLLQLAARLLRHDQPVAAAVAAPRWVLRGRTGFDTWTSARVAVSVEGGSPPAWAGLASYGHDVVTGAPGDGAYGHAHAIVRTARGWDAAADPRTLVGAALTG